jgi:hypothetical protein
MTYRAGMVVVEETTGKKSSVARSYQLNGLPIISTQYLPLDLSIHSMV